MFAKSEDILNAIKQNTKHVNSFDEVDILVSELESNRERVCLIFSSSAIKDYFLSSSNYNIINCNSSYNRFCEDLNSKYNTRDILFVNLRDCNDINILQLIDSTNNIIVY